MTPLTTAGARRTWVACWAMRCGTSTSACCSSWPPASTRRWRWPTGLDWLAAFRAAVAQAEDEFRAAVGVEVATVVALGLEVYADGQGPP